MTVFEKSFRFRITFPLFIASYGQRGTEMKEETLKKLIILGITYEPPGPVRPMEEHYRRFMELLEASETGTQEGTPSGDHQ